MLEKALKDIDETKSRDLDLFSFIEEGLTETDCYNNTFTDNDPLIHSEDNEDKSLYCEFPEPSADDRENSLTYESDRRKLISLMSDPILSSNKIALQTCQGAEEKKEQGKYTLRL